MCFFGAVAHQSSMQELDLLNPQLDPRISYSGGPKWYFGSDGLLHESRGNFVTYSEDFTNPIWNKNTGVSVTANAAAAPNGTMTADAVTYSGAGAAGSYRIYTTVLAGAPTGLLACSSIWLRSDVPVTLRISTNQAFRTYTVTSTWQRFDCPFLGGGAVNWQLAIYSATGDNTPFTLYMWGAQAEKGSQTPGYYLPTSGSVTYEWPLEYDPITLKPIGRSVWEQRTNLLLYSEEFTNAWWTKASIGVATAPVVTGAYATAPNGSLTASRVQMSLNGGTTSSDISSLERAVAVTVGTTYAGSVYLKANGPSEVGKVIEIRHAANAAYTKVTLTAAWQRFSGAETAGSTVGTWCIRIRGGVGDSSSVDLLVWGAQMEAGAFASPLIPTAGSQVTRVADIADVSASDSKMRHNTAGMTAYAEGVCYDSNDSGAGSGGNGQNALIMLGDGLADQAALRRNDTGSRVFRLYGYVRDAVNPVAVLEGADNSYAPNVVTKAALALKPGNHAAASGGVVIGPDSSAVAVPSANLKLGRGYTTTIAPLNGVLRKVRFYPARLSATELQALTA